MDQPSSAIRAVHLMGESEAWFVVNGLGGWSKEGFPSPTVTHRCAKCKSVTHRWLAYSPAVTIEPSPGWLPAPSPLRFILRGCPSKVFDMVLATVKVVAGS